MMKCPICGKKTLPGAKLCGPCRSALKRARDDSVWVLPPSQRPGEAPPEEPHPASSRTAQWVLGSPRLRGWRVWAVAGGMLGACVLAGLRFAGGEEPVAPPTAASRPSVEDPMPGASPRAVPTAGEQAAPGSVVPTGTIVHADEALVQPPRREYSVPRTPKASHPAAEPAVVPPPAPVEPPPPETPRIVAASPPPPAARPVDPMQRLDDALGRCRGQDLFSRLGCEYRARSTYCEGHWGESPQCPAPTGNDHGQ